MKLKTLKDIEGSDVELFVNERVVGVYELKAEAIKWVKFYKEQNKSNRILFGDKVIKSMEEGNELLVLWITDFFNITEDDLK